ncbi:MAG TPA: SPOR domain-containing protein [Saprospiraceae bacterium]|nr:SPOR domain-containing protein [Saprospiraceae bacterium]
MGKLLNLLLLVLLLLFFVGLFIGLNKAVKFLNSHQAITEQTEQVVSDKEIANTAIPLSEEEIDSTKKEMSDEEILDRLDEILADDEDEDFELDDLEKKDTSIQGPVIEKEKESKTDLQKKQTQVKTKRVVSKKKSRYYVIVGSFKEKKNAKIELKNMKRFGYQNARIINFAARGYTTVILDNYISKSKANRIAKTLKSKYKREAYVRRRK